MKLFEIRRRVKLIHTRTHAYVNLLVKVQRKVLTNARLRISRASKTRKTKHPTIRSHRDTIFQLTHAITQRLMEKIVALEDTVKNHEKKTLEGEKA